MISGRTKVIGVIGDPITQSLSPVMHNAAFAFLNLDYVYVAFPVLTGQAPEAVRAMPILGIVGLNVTTPHKTTAAVACDELSSHAQQLQAVNTLILREDGTIFGDSTDGAGFINFLKDEHVEISNRTVLVIGAGGSARAVIQALGEHNARVLVAARRADAAKSAASLAPNAEPLEFTAIPQRLPEADIVVHCTPVGMLGEDPVVELDALRPNQIVVDLINNPRQTKLLKAAAVLGCRTFNGLEMLVHQGALSFEMWTGQPAPWNAMRAAVETAQAS